METPASISLVKSNEDLRKALKARLKDVCPKYPGKKNPEGPVEIHQSMICKDAKERGFNITPQQLNKYLNHGHATYSLKEDQILWLCVRYGIDISLRVGEPKVEGKSIKYKIRPYSESECLKRLKDIFG